MRGILKVRNELPHLRHERCAMMRLCTCEACRYIFRYPLIPPRCPDCGKGPVREAAEREIAQYQREQKILEEEIRAGLWGNWGNPITSQT